MRSSRWTRWGTLAGTAFVLVGLGGCVIAPPRPVVYAPGPPPSQPMPRGNYPDGVVMVAPPPPYQEVAGYPPAPGFVWIGGFWNWTGARHVWVAGRWEQGRPHHIWRPHQWVRYGAGWRFEPGHWYRG